MYRFFFFNDTATTEIYTLSLHDALPIGPPPARAAPSGPPAAAGRWRRGRASRRRPTTAARRSEEHTSELQSRQYLVCRLLLVKKILCSVLTYQAHSLFFQSPPMSYPVLS